MAQVQIGGVTKDIPTLSFYTVKRAWPYLKASQALAGDDEGVKEIVRDPVEAMTNAVGIIAHALAQSDSELQALRDDPVDGERKLIDKVSQQITSEECFQLDRVITQIMVEAGFLKFSEDGQAKPGEPLAASPSTATGTPLSPSSSPPAVKAEAGIE